MYGGMFQGKWIPKSGMRVFVAVRLATSASVPVAGVARGGAAAAAVLLLSAGVACGRPGCLRHRRHGLLGYVHAWIRYIDHCKLHL